MIISCFWQVISSGYDARKEAEEFIRKKKDKKFFKLKVIDDEIGE